MVSVAKPARQEAQAHSHEIMTLVLASLNQGYSDGFNWTEMKMPYFKQNVTNRFLMISWWAKKWSNDLVEIPKFSEMMGFSYLNGHWWRFPLGACREGRPKRPFRQVPSLHPKDSRTNGLHDLYLLYQKYNDPMPGNPLPFKNGRFRVQFDYNLLPR